MTATVKIAKEVNYTNEQTAELVNLYVGGTTTAELAEKFGKTVRSIVAKLSREKVYTKPTRTTKTGDAIVKKDSVADAIGAVLRLSENDISSLTKANNTALQAIFSALANSKPIE